MALHAFLSCHKIAELLGDQKSGLAEKFRKNINIYEEFACNMINKSCHYEKKSGKDLILRENPSFNYLSVVQMASEGECLELAQLPAIQGILDEAWFGNVNQKKSALMNRMMDKTRLMCMTILTRDFIEGRVILR